MFYCFDRKALPVREIEFADEVTHKIRHKGWFADANGYGDRGTVRGFVARISHGRYLTGHYWSDNGEYVLNDEAVFHGETEAARAADEDARIYAEGLQEDDARFNAMTMAETLVEELHTDVREAFENRHKGRKARAWVSEVIENLRGARDDYKKARTAYERD